MTALASSGGSSTWVISASGPDWTTGQYYTPTATLAAGRQAVVTASGTWNVCGGGCSTDGNEFAFTALDFVCPNQPAGTLDGGATCFEVGDGPTTVTGPGTLALGGDDWPGSTYADNLGSLTVTITPVAPPMPTSKNQCKNGSWQTYGVFKNQGDCVSYVATHGKNGPNG